MSGPPAESEGSADAATPGGTSGPLAESGGSAEVPALGSTSSLLPQSEGGAEAPAPALGVPPPAVSSYELGGARGHNERVYGPFVPILLVVLGGVAWAAFQCYELVNEQQSLATFYSNQNRAFEDSGKLRNALEGITRETALLASQGNPGAKLIVDELARRGVTITPNAVPITPKADK
jgi:hypothetical protein